MSNNCSTRKAWILICLLVGFLSNNAWAVTAFFYHDNPPLPELSQFDQLVIEPAVITENDIELLKNEQTAVFAYFSIGEIKDPSLEQQKWVLDKNRHWQSAVVDVSNEEWFAWVLEQRIPQLIDRGFDGLFLDTLDSYRLVAKSQSDVRRHQKSLARLIKRIKETYPQLKLIFNRGFELLDELGPQNAKRYVHEMVAESLYQTWDAKRQSYRSVSADDQQWLLDKLLKTKALGIPVTVIDYVDPAKPGLARKTLAKIEEQGFSAWISSPELNAIGLAAIEIEPRRVLFLYDSLLSPLAMNPAHTVLGNTFDYLGLRVDYHDIREGVPTIPSNNLYVAIATWLEAGHSAGLNQLEQWINQQIDSGTRLLVFNAVPFQSAELLQRLGINKQSLELTPPFRAIEKSTLIDSDTRIANRIIGLQPVVSSADNKILLRMHDADDREFHPLLIGDWGGMALDPYLYTELKPGFRRWVLDPVAFIRKSLPNLPALIADTTTENGRRILLSHIDGDGFVSKAELPGTPYSAEVCLDKVLKRYRLAHTVSVIEGEIGPSGQFPKESPTLEAIARKIFALDYVEAASHSYSHPFVWEPGKYSRPNPHNHDHALHLQGYTTEMQREVLGSIDYINQRLLPDDKRVAVMLWTGDALPGEQAIASSYEAGVVNVNGGNTKVTYAYPSTTGIYPQLRPTRAGIQVYAPIMNENIYTNEWLGPFYGFGKVIETFELTDSPRRYKPVSIYWHFYSCTKTGSLRALYDVYDWALQQPHTSVFLSEFADKVKGFQQLSIAKKLDGSYQLKGLGGLRTVRAEPSLGYPQPSRSKGLAGFSDDKQGRYLHLGPGEVNLVFSDSPDKHAYLQSANARLNYWRYQSGEIALRLSGEEPVELLLANAGKCKLKLPEGKSYSQKQLSSKLTAIKLRQRDTGHALLVC
jgi:uncharacterized protein (TIGR01370 family)